MDNNKSSSKDTVLAKSVAGSLLRKARLEHGLTLKEIAGKLGLPNANYLSMIENGTNSIPLKRLWDFVEVYGLAKVDGLTIIKLTTPDLWTTLVEGLKAGGLTDVQADTLVNDVEKRIEKEVKGL